MSDLREFEGGATRSFDADKERYDLMSPFAARRAAIIYAEGAKIHGERNWEKAKQDFFDACLNHLERHLILWKMGDRSEDHLAKIRVNADFIMHYEEVKNEAT